MKIIAIEIKEKCWFIKIIEAGQKYSFYITIKDVHFKSEKTAFEMRILENDTEIVNTSS